ncbi:hypothetical protein P5673_007806 [Acropora cervicornis]|uniref:Uncharacterized protein n=1 Tax=Acropora cervicornis TaxID=6130 RepID=A0AAD9QV25_ACRCE|nr:hypothetical protein P5673_007806 [Acropora cervicornis]
MDTVNLPHPNSLRKFGLALNPAHAFPAIAEEANTSLAFPNVASQQERYRSVPEIRRITKAGSADGMRKSTRWALVASSLQDHDNFGVLDRPVCKWNVSGIIKTADQKGQPSKAGPEFKKDSKRTNVPIFPCVAKSLLVSLSILNEYSDLEALVKERLPSQAVKDCGAEFSSPRSANPMFKTTSRRMQRQASFSEIAGKLMDATSETSRKLSRQIHRLTRAQEEQELQRLREEEEVAQNAKKRKKDNFASCLIQRKLSIFASYRRVSFPRDTLSEKEVRTVQMQ